MTKFLRIVRTVVTGLGVTAAVLLAALWVHSASWKDTFIGPIPLAGGGFEAESLHGQVVVVGRVQEELWWPARVYSVSDTLPDFGCSNTYHFQFRLPHWCLVSMAGAIAAVPWIRLQYSLRTMLIVMTLVAVVLGVRAASGMP